MHKKKIQGKNSQFKREPKDGSCWVTKQKRALVHSALRCVMICFWRMVFMLSGEAFLEQWLMWCPKCHGFHITHKLFSASCQSTSRREELKRLKKGESKFLVEHVQVSAVGFCPQRPNAHVHARTYTQFRQTWILVYTLTEKHTHAKGSLSLLDTHSNTRTHAQWKSWLIFSIVRQVTLNIYTAWQSLCPRFWALVNCELSLHRESAPLVAVNMSFVYTVS